MGSFRLRVLTGLLFLGGFPLTQLTFMHGAAAQATESQSFPSVRGDTLVVQNDYGRVHVSTWGTDLIDAQIRRIAPSEAQLQNVVVLAAKVQNKVFLTSHFYDFEAESVYLSVRVPPYVNVVVSGANTAVEIEDVAGYVRVMTQTGLITASNLTGSTSLHTDTGTLVFRSYRQPVGDVRLETTRANIDCQMAPDVNFRGWLRAGGNLSWNGEVEFSSGHLEKQVGDGGPLLLAVSQEGAVRVRLDAQVPSPQAVAARSQEPPTRSEPDVVPPDETPVAAPRIEPEPEPRRPLPEPSAPAQRTPAGTDQSPDGEGNYSLKVDVNWTYLNASVRERTTNRSVPRLDREDFLLYEDNEQQTVERVETTEAPFNLLLLLDVSGSTRSHIDLIKEASVSFTEQINPNDHIAIAVFNSRVRLLQDFTNDRRQVAQTIRRIKSGGGTAFYDALETSIDEYMEGIDGRKAIVVFTDGVDNQLTGDWSDGSKTTFPQLFRRIQEVDTIVYTIFLDTRERSLVRRPPPGTGRGGSIVDILEDIMRRYPNGIPGGGGTIGGGRGMDDDAAYEEARQQLALIAEQTGGRMYSPYNIYDLDTVYREIADDLRVQYTLAYSSTNPNYDNKWREIRLRVRNRSDLVVRTRRGYYATAGRGGIRTN